MNPPIRDWSALEVWVIGASSGIGAETALLLARKGARLILSGRRQDRLQALRTRFSEPQHNHTTVLPFDLCVLEQVQEAAQALFEQGHSIDLVIVASGVYDALSATHFDSTQMDQIEQVLDTNLKGAYHVLAALLPNLRHRGQGRLAFISSVAGYGGLPRALAYGPSKAALNQLCESLYYELKPLGVSVYRICPGFVKTAMTAVNDFRMPALIEPQEAAAEIVAGLERGDFDIHFPRRFTGWLRIMRCLPRGLYFRLLARASRGL